MANKSQFQAIKGTRDLLPAETALWNQVEQTAREVFTSFNFGEIRLPIFEPTELFARAVGGDTDIVGKEMYTFEDRPVTVSELTNLSDLAEFVTSVEQSIARGEIPNTISNQQAVKALRRKFDDFAAASRQLKPGLAVGSQPPGTEEYLSRLYETFFFGGYVQLGESISLRPEATASVCRAYIEHSMQQLPS